MQTTHERVLHFINLIKGHKNFRDRDAHKIIEQINMRGNCYMFAKTLQFVFPQAIIYGTKDWGGHAAAYIDGKLYDIKGEITEDSRWTPEAFIPMTPEQEKKASTWCYSHVSGCSVQLMDKNGRDIKKLDSLVYDDQRKAWSLPEMENEYNEAI